VRDEMRTEVAYEVLTLRRTRKGSSSWGEVGNSCGRRTSHNHLTTWSPPTVGARPELGRTPEGRGVASLFLSWCARGKLLKFR